MDVSQYTSISVRHAIQLRYDIRSITYVGFSKKKALSWLIPLASIMAIGAIACSSARPSTAAGRTASAAPAPVAPAAPAQAPAMPAAPAAPAPAAPAAPAMAQVLPTPQAPQLAPVPQTQTRQPAMMMSSDEAQMGGTLRIVAAGSIQSFDRCGRPHRAPETFPTLSSKDFSSTRATTESLPC